MVARLTVNDFKLGLLPAQQIMIEILSGGTSPFTNPLHVTFNGVRNDEAFWQMIETIEGRAKELGYHPPFDRDQGGILWGDYVYMRQL